MDGQMMITMPIARPLLKYGQPEINCCSSDKASCYFCWLSNASRNRSNITVLHKLCISKSL